MYPHIYDTAFDWITEGSRVLDLGTGDGAFLARIVREKNVEGEGVEQDSEMVARCIEQGLVVHQGDVMDGLDQYGDNTFDYALMIGTFQELHRPHHVMKEAFRVARRLIVAYHNFSYWRIRVKLLVGGRVPVTPSMPHRWYESPNMNFCSILDFHNMCDAYDFIEEKNAYFNSSGAKVLFPNFFAEQVLTMLRAEDGNEHRSLAES